MVSIISSLEQVAESASFVAILLIKSGMTIRVTGGVVSVGDP